MAEDDVNDDAEDFPHGELKPKEKAPDNERQPEEKAHDNEP